MSALKVSSASQSGSLKIIRSGQLSHVTIGATEHTMLGHNKNDRKRIWRLHTNSYKKQIIRGKKIKVGEKKSILPSPQVFTNSFHNVQNKIKILSQAKTNYIGRPSVKRDYTNSFEWHTQPLSEALKRDGGLSINLF